MTVEKGRHPSECSELAKMLVEVDVRHPVQSGHLED